MIDLAPTPSPSASYRYLPTYTCHADYPAGTRVRCVYPPSGDPWRNLMGEVVALDCIEVRYLCELLERMGGRFEVMP